MKIPNLEQGKICNSDGTPAPAYLNYHAAINTELQNNVSNEGYVVPQQNTANITNIAQKSLAQQSIVLIHDNETDETKLIINGVVKTITVS
jgi:hypothetical protein